MLNNSIHRMASEVDKRKQNHQRSNRRTSYCVARWCNNNNVNSIAMFRLPKGTRGRIWLGNADRHDLLTLDENKLHRRYMCNKHFTPECFLKTNLLTWNAVPTLFKTYTRCQELQPNIAINTMPFITTRKQAESSNSLEEVLGNGPKTTVIERNGAAKNASNVDFGTQTISKPVFTTLVNDHLQLTEEAKRSLPVIKKQVLTLVDINFHSGSITPKSRLKTSSEDPKELLSERNVHSAVKITPAIKPRLFPKPTTPEINTKLFVAMKNKISEKNSTSNDVILPSAKTDTIVAKNKCLNMQPTVNIITASINMSQSSETTIKREGFASEQSDFLEPFATTKQDAMLPCAACGEVFLVESGLTQHVLRYHCDTDIRALK